MLPTLLTPMVTGLLTSGGNNRKLVVCHSLSKDKNVGLATAKSVLRIPRQEIIDRADLEEDTVDYVLGVLRAEFED